MKDKALHFEALKAGYAQTKGGHSLRLQIATDDLPKEIREADIGTRYLVALVEMPETQEDFDAYTGNRAVQLAGILCKDPLFLEWYTLTIDNTPQPVESEVADSLRRILKIKSRSDLATNGLKRDAFYEIYKRFDAYRQQHAYRGR